jgi:septal ring factor EnvC (AmiA/AmiB activator)
MKCVLLFFALLVSSPVPSSATSSTITPQEIQTWLELCKSLRTEIEALKSSSANSRQSLQELEQALTDSGNQIAALSQSLETSEAKTTELTRLLTEAQALSTSLNLSLDELRRERDVERVWWVVGIIVGGVASWGVGRWK